MLFPHYQTDSVWKSNILFAWKRKLQMCRTLDSAVVLYGLPGCLHARGLIKDGKRSAENTHTHTHIQGTVLLTLHFSTLSPSHKVMGQYMNWQSMPIPCQEILVVSKDLQSQSFSLLQRKQWKCLWGNNTPCTNLPPNVNRSTALHSYHVPAPEISTTLGNKHLSKHSDKVTEIVCYLTEHNN